MKLTEFFLQQLEIEGATTRRVLERVPEGRNDWKPHEKSMPLGYLAALVARMPAWIELMANLEQFDVHGPEAAAFTPTAPTNNRELVDSLDQSLAQAREALSKTDDQKLMTQWKFLAKGHIVSQEPRYQAIRDAMLSHWAHHRGQLTVYLRLNEAPVPAVYGPSADEGKF